MKVLVVEDDIKIQQSLSANLKSECFSVTVASDGESGLRLARAGDFDVIVLDYLLPTRDGLEVCTQLRTEGVTSHIIGLSVKSETVNKVRFLNAGADDYLTKPFSFSELTARMRALMRRSPVLSSEIISINDLTLDSRKHSVTLAGEAVSLTRKEYLLLDYLMRNRGTVLSRAMILEHVWDMNADPFSNTIETHIMTLRKKIQKKPKPSIILNVPGIGYKME